MTSRAGGHSGAGRLKIAPSRRYGRVNEVRRARIAGSALVSKDEDVAIGKGNAGRQGGELHRGSLIAAVAVVKQCSRLRL